MVGLGIPLRGNRGGVEKCDTDFSGIVKGHQKMSKSSEDRNQNASSTSKFRNFNKQERWISRLVVLVGAPLIVVIMGLIFEYGIIQNLLMPDDELTNAQASTETPDPLDRPLKALSSPDFITTAVSIEPDFLQLTSGVGNNYQPSFSPDGEIIAFISTRHGEQDVFIMKTDGSNQQRLTNTPNVAEDRPSFSPDGTKLIFGGVTNDNEDLYVYNFDSKVIHQLTNTLDVNEGRPKFYEGIFDELFILFDTDETGNWEIFSAKYDNANSKIENHAQITHNTNSGNRFPSHISNKDRILYRSQKNSKSNISICERECTDPKNLSNDFNDWYPIVTVDNERIIFVTDRDGNEEIYSMNISGEDLERLTNNSDKDTTPAVSPNGNWLVFASTRNEGHFHLYRILLQP